MTQRHGQCPQTLHRVVLKPLAMLVQVMSQQAGVEACRMILAERAMDGRVPTGPALCALRTKGNIFHQAGTGVVRTARSSAGPVSRLKFRAQLIKPTWL